MTCSKNNNLSHFYYSVFITEIIPIVIYVYDFLVRLQWSLLAYIQEVSDLAILNKHKVKPSVVTIKRLGF